MRERETHTERNRGCGKLTMPPYKPPVTDRRTDRQTEVMASNVIKQVNRSHIRTHTHTVQTHTSWVTVCTHTAVRAGDRKAQADTGVPESDTDIHTASVWPQHISLHYCQRAASVSLALLLMPSAWCTAILAACLSISLHPNPQSLNHGTPRPFLGRKHKKIPQLGSLRRRLCSSPSGPQKPTPGG